MIELKNVGKSFGDHLVFSNVDLNLPDRGFYLLAGENGSGKSTLLSILSGVETNHDGEMFFKGKIVDVKTASSYREKHVGMVFQESFVLDSLTVLENLLFPYGSNDRERGSQILEKVGLLPLCDEPVSNLSSGERQRLMIAMAIYEDKEVLLLDEALNYLDEDNAKGILSLLSDLGKSRLVILSSHDDVLSLGARPSGILTVAGGGIELSMQKEEEALEPAVQTAHRDVLSARRLLAFFFRKEKALFVVLLILIPFFLGLSLIGLGDSYGRKSEEEAGNAIVLRNFKVHGFSPIPGEAPKPLEGTKVSFLSRVEELSISDRADLGLTASIDIFTPQDENAYRIVEGMGRKAQREDELVISSLVYEKILGSTHTAGDGTVYPIASFQDLEKIPYRLFPSMGTTWRVVGIYEADTSRDAFYTAQDGRILRSSPLYASYGRTAFFTSLENSLLSTETDIYFTDTLSLDELKGYRSMNLIPASEEQRDFYREIGVIEEVASYVLLGFVALFSAVFMGLFISLEKRRVIYFRLIGIPGKSLARLFLLVAGVATGVSGAILLVGTPAWIAGFDAYYRSSYLGAGGLSFGGWSYIPFLTLFLFGLLSFFWLRIFGRRYLKKDVSKLLELSKKSDEE